VSKVPLTPRRALLLFNFKLKANLSFIDKSHMQQTKEGFSFQYKAMFAYKG